MELLTGKKRQELQDLLLSLPNIGDPATRDLLLADLPAPIRNVIPAANAPGTHIANIVGTLNDDALTQADGTVPLRTVLENAIYLVRGARLAGQLQAVLDALTASAAATVAAAPPSPPNVAPATPPALSLTNLTGPQRKQLYTALLSAFPTLADLRRMVTFGLSQNLDQITTGGSLDQMALDLITWAQARGRTEDLVRAALDDNPDNSTLQAFGKTAGLIT